MDTKGTKVRLWRWRRNPLKRSSDVAEAWAVLAAGVLLAVGAPMVGVVTAVGVEEAAVRQSQELRTISAVLAENAPAAARNVYIDPNSDRYIGSNSDRVRATVRWTASDGSSRTGKALVPADRPAGTRTTVWLDGRGALHDPPASPGQAAELGVVIGSLAATGVCLLVVGGRRAVRFRLDRHREAQWEHEWAEVGAKWRHRTA
jgi:hypothetical protein